MAERMEVDASIIDRSRYRAFLHHLGTHLTTTNVDELIYLADLPGGESQHITSPLSLFKSLELHGYLNPSLGGLDYLKEHFALINRLDLSRKVESFLADCQRPQENADQIFPSKAPQPISVKAKEVSFPRKHALKKPSDYSMKSSIPTVNYDSTITTNEECTATVPSKKMYNKQAVSNEDQPPATKTPLEMQTTSVVKEKLSKSTTLDAMEIDDVVCNEKLSQVQPIEAGQNENNINILPPVDQQNYVDEEDQEEGVMNPRSYCFSSAPVVAPFQQKITESSDFYRMDRIPHGICVILNNEDFTQSIDSDNCLDYREGSQVDVDTLKDVFAYLKFDVRIVENLSAEKVRGYFMEIAEEDHSRYDCFVGCVLSHGCNDGFYGVDGNVVTINEVLYGFKTCPSLRGKPKLFFGQFCRGDNVDKVYVPDSKANNNIFRENPSEADFFIAYATPPGYVSWRSRSNGTWFISKLCQWLKETAHELDLDHIMKKVKKAVGESYTSEYQKQIPFVCETLTKRVKFL